MITISSVVVLIIAILLGAPRTRNQNLVKTDMNRRMATRFVNNLFEKKSTHHYFSIIIVQETVKLASANTIAKKPNAAGSKESPTRADKRMPRGLCVLWMWLTEGRQPYLQR